MFRSILLVSMAEEEKKQKAVKKTAAKKKSVVSASVPKKTKAKPKEEKSKQIVPTVDSSLPKIYNDSKFTKHPSYPTNDLIKVLVRSPKEAFVFWKFSEKTFERITNDLESTSTDGLRFRLKVEYQNVFGSDRVEWYDLAPFTESYYLKFMFPVRMVQCTIFVAFGEREIPTLHSTGKDLPPTSESFRLDKDWIHPKWIEEGLVIQSPSGEYYFRDENASGYYVNPRNHSLDPNENLKGTNPFANGSGSGKGLL